MYAIHRFFLATMTHLQYYLSSKYMYLYAQCHVHVHEHYPLAGVIVQLAPVVMAYCTLHTANSSQLKYSTIQCTCTVPVPAHCHCTEVGHQRMTPLQSTGRLGGYLLLQCLSSQASMQIVQIMPFKVAAAFRHPSHNCDKSLILNLSNTNWMERRIENVSK